MMNPRDLPAASAAMAVREACPFCDPDIFDGALDEVPDVKLCELHVNHPCAEVFEQPAYRRSAQFRAALRQEEIGQRIKERLKVRLIEEGLLP